jgi:hypothetical protein
VPETITLITGEKKDTGLRNFSLKTIKLERISTATPRKPARTEHIGN